MTSFKARHGQYEFVVMSLRLKGALSTFMDLMNRVFKYFLDLFVIVFINDIFIYLRNEEENLTHMRVHLHTLIDCQIF